MRQPGRKWGNRRGFFFSSSLARFFFVFSLVVSSIQSVFCLQPQRLIFDTHFAFTLRTPSKGDKEKIARFPHTHVPCSSRKKRMKESVSFSIGVWVFRHTTEAIVALTRCRFGPHGGSTSEVGNEREINDGKKMGTHERERAMLDFTKRSLKSPRRLLWFLPANRKRERK